MDTGSINIIEKNGSTVSAEGISYIKIPSTGKEYLFYTLNEAMDNGLVKMYVAEVAPEGLQASPIDNQAWDNLKKLMLNISHGEAVTDVEYLSMKDKTFNIGDAKKLGVKADKKQAFIEAHNQAISGELQNVSPEEPAFVSPEETQVNVQVQETQTPVVETPTQAPEVAPEPVQPAEAAIPVQTETVESVQEAAPIITEVAQTPTEVSAPVTTISIEEALNAANTLTTFLNELVNSKEYVEPAVEQTTTAIDTNTMELAQHPEIPTDSLVSESDLSDMSVPTVDVVNPEPLPVVETPVAEASIQETSVVENNELPPIPESTTVPIEGSEAAIQEPQLIDTPQVDAPQMIDMTQLTAAPEVAPVVDTPLIETPAIDVTPVEAPVVDTPVAPAVPPMDSVGAEAQAMAVPDVTPVAMEPVNITPEVQNVTEIPLPTAEAPMPMPEVPTMETPSIGSDVPVQMPDGMVGNSAPDFSGGILSPTTYDANNPSLGKAA